MLWRVTSRDIKLSAPSDISRFGDCGCWYSASCYAAGLHSPCRPNSKLVNDRMHVFILQDLYHRYDDISMIRSSRLAVEFSNTSYAVYFYRTSSAWMSPVE